MNTVDQLVAIFGIEEYIEEDIAIVHGLNTNGTLSSVHLRGWEIGGLKVNYTADQKNQAIVSYTEEHKNDPLFGYGLIGSVIHLKRSRKAPNKKDLLVIDFQDRFFDSRFNCWIDEKLIVKDQQTNLTYAVSYNCFDRVITANVKLPFYLQ